jgi:hypothetical protein
MHMGVVFNLNINNENQDYKIGTMSLCVGVLVMKEGD